MRRNLILAGAVILLVLGAAASAPVIREFLAPVLRKPPWDEALSRRRDAGYVLALDHPQNPEEAVLVISAEPDADLLAMVRKLPHYGKYGCLLFHGETNAAKGIWEVERSPLVHVF